MRELVKLLVELERGSGLRERPGGELSLLHGSGRFQTTRCWAACWKTSSKRFPRSQMPLRSSLDPLKVNPRCVR